MSDQAPPPEAPLPEPCEHEWESDDGTPTMCPPCLRTRAEKAERGAAEWRSACESVEGALLTLTESAHKQHAKDGEEIAGMRERALVAEAKLKDALEELSLQQEEVCDACLGTLEPEALTKQIVELRAKLARVEGGRDEALRRENKLLRAVSDGQEAEQADHVERHGSQMAQHIIGATAIREAFALTIRQRTELTATSKALTEARELAELHQAMFYRLEALCIQHMGGKAEPRLPLPWKAQPPKQGAGDRGGVCDGE